MQFTLLLERGTIDAIFMLRRMQGKKLCFVHLEKTFDRVVSEEFEVKVRLYRRINAVTCSFCRCH